MGTFNPGGLNAPPKSIVNQFSSGGVIGAGIADANGAKQVLSGALTAATYKELLAISGSGVLEMAYAKAMDATSRTVGLKIIIDGTTVFDAVSGTTTTADTCVLAVGNRGYFAAGINSYLTRGAVPFNSSLSIQAKSSLSETDKVAVGYAYRLT